MAHRTPSKPILSLRSLSEVCGKDFFNSGIASAQCPVSASFAPRSGTEEESAVAEGFLATWACATAAISARRKPVGIVFKRSLINKKKAGTLSACLRYSTLGLGLVVEL